MNILLLDDNADVWTVFGPALKSAYGAGARFFRHTGESVGETAEKVLAEKPDVVLLDGELESGVLGYEVAEELLRRQPGIRCVGFSSAGSLRGPFLSAGAIGFVQKDPADPVACIGRVEDLLHA